MKTTLCLVLLFTVLPILAAAGLISFDPNIWGGSFTLRNILGLAFFGIATVPLWLTYIPTLIVTPWVMGKLSNYHLFYSIPLWKFILISFFSGMVCGIFILSPCIFMASSSSIKLVLNWAFAGAVSGSMTFTIIAFIYRATGASG